MSPKADQQEGREARQLPEHQQQQHVLRKDDAQHGGHEQHEQSIKSADAVLRGQVITRIENDEQPNTKNQQPKHEAQPVEPERKIEPEVRQPPPTLEKLFAR